MKILLINPVTYPSIDEFVYDAGRMKVNCDEPIGLMYIKAYIEQEIEDISVELFDWHMECLSYYCDTNKLTKNDCHSMLDNKIKEVKPDIVGVSALYEMNAKISLNVAEAAKKINNNIIVVMGGIYMPH